ncbi:glyoxalase [Streptomyces aureoverticillatus]|nr:glyoxalase [Streptomyces aureoverticillatus]
MRWTPAAPLPDSAAMTTLVRHVTFDCSDAYALASFWAGVLEGQVSEEDFPGDPEALVTTPEGPTLLFVSVPEKKSVKNRVHFDLQPQDRSRDEEVERVVALGATLVGDHRLPDGRGWVTLADPEGNEFCVERSSGERAAATS